MQTQISKITFSAVPFYINKTYQIMFKQIRLDTRNENDETHIKKEYIYVISPSVVSRFFYVCDYNASNPDILHGGYVCKIYSSMHVHP